MQDRLLNGRKSLHPDPGTGSSLNKGQKIVQQCILRPNPKNRTLNNSDLFYAELQIDIVSWRMDVRWKWTRHIEFYRLETLVGSAIWREHCNWPSKKETQLMFYACYKKCLKITLYLSNKHGHFHSTSKCPLIHSISWVFIAGLGSISETNELASIFYHHFSL